MYIPKTDIYNILKTLPYLVSQKKPNVFKELPAITFFVLNNAIGKIDHDKNILWQDLAIQIDIWADDSISASNILKEVTELMLNNDYILTFSNDMDEKDLYHIATRFEKIV